MGELCTKLCTKNHPFTNHTLTWISCVQKQWHQNFPAKKQETVLFYRKTHVIIGIVNCGIRWQTIFSVHCLGRYPLIQPKIGAKKPEVRKSVDRARLNGPEYFFVFRSLVGLNVYFIRLGLGFPLPQKSSPYSLYSSEPTTSLIHLLKKKKKKKTQQNPLINHKAMVVYYVYKRT